MVRPLIAFTLLQIRKLVKSWVIIVPIAAPSIPRTGINKPLNKTLMKIAAAENIARNFC